MDRYFPTGNKGEPANVYGYGVAQGLVQVLKQCGDDLTRANVMRQAANLDFQIEVYLPGIRVKTSPTDFYPIDQLQMTKFEGKSWKLFGPVIDGLVRN